MNDADKTAMRAWYRVMYFSGGMLVPLAVALRQSAGTKSGASTD